MISEIITIGDELLIGQVINTNQAFISDTLNSVGIFTEQMVTVGDAEPEILRAFESAWKHYNVVAITGGLGPTHDDITRACVCKFFQTDLIVDEQSLENVRILFARRGAPLTKINEEQALVPRGCTVIHNRLGTAPGYFFERDGKYFIVMPGVPYEMKGMMESFVIPFFEKRTADLVVRYRTLKTTGIAESFLAEQIGDVKNLFPPNSGTSLAFLPSSAGVRLRITVQAKTILDAERRLQDVETKIRSSAEKYIYASGDAELEDVLGMILTEKNFSLAIAESCTGGLIADRMTNVPGSSNYFERGIIAYSNESKVQDLDVPESLIQQHGAVSKEVAEAMAAGIRAKSNADIGISTTGIAGPTGATADKPLGLVWIGYSDASTTLAIKHIFNGERRIVKERASQAALELLRRKLLNISI